MENIIFDKMHSKIIKQDNNSNDSDCKPKFFLSASAKGEDQNLGQKRLSTLKKLDKEGVINLGIDHKYLSRLESSINFDEMASETYQTPMSDYNDQNIP